MLNRYSCTFGRRLDVFWRDLEEGRTIRLSVNTANVEGNLDSGNDQERPALTGDGIMDLLATIEAEARLDLPVAAGEPPGPGEA